VSLRFPPARRDRPMPFKGRGGLSSYEIYNWWVLWAQTWTGAVMSAIVDVPLGEEAAAAAAVRAGDEVAFATLAERYRRQLQVHCYRMLGSVQDAEDIVQETLLRAWRAHASFEGRSLFRTWLYRIATNLCLNALERWPRRITPPNLGPATDNPRAELIGSLELPWLEPYPDHFLESAAPADAEPDAVVSGRETIELVYLAAIQHLPPRQRAIFILRDTLGWSARETASLLESSLASVKSALQRARATMRRSLPDRRLDWTFAPQPTAEELAILRRFMDAYEQSDVGALTALLREDARQTMPPIPAWYEGRAAIVAQKAWWLGPGSIGDLRAVPTAANRRPRLRSTSGGSTTPSTASSVSMCCGSRTDRSSISAPSSIRSSQPSACCRRSDGRGRRRRPALVPWAAVCARFRSPPDHAGARPAAQLRRRGLERRPGRRRARSPGTRVPQRGTPGFRRGRRPVS
jgi:RNA polymerase sigma-70 factor (ECF subfamily)